MSYSEILVQAPVNIDEAQTRALLATNHSHHYKVHIHEIKTSPEEINAGENFNWRAF